MNPNISPEMDPRTALKLLDYTSAPFKGDRSDHFNIQKAVMVLGGFIDLHAPLDQGNNGASIPESENHEPKDNLKNVDSPSNTTDTPEENKVLSKKKK